MKLKKSHVPVILASILLVILVGTLIYVIFFMKDSDKVGLFAKKIDSYKVDVKVADYEDTPDSIDYDHMDYKEVKVTNYVNNELINSEIMSGNVNMLKTNNGFVLYSNSDDSYFMKTGSDFNTKTNFKFSKDGYSVKAVNEIKNKYYLILSKDNKIYGTIIDEKGKKSKYYEITSVEKYNSYDVIATEDGFVIYLEKSPIVKFKKINLDFKLDDVSYDLHEVHSDLVGTSLLIQDISTKNGIVYCFLQSFGKGTKNNYIVAFDKNLKETKFVNINDVTLDGLSISLYNDSIFVNKGSSVTVYNIETETKIVRDYSSQLEENTPAIFMLVSGTKDSIVLYVNTGLYNVIDVIEGNKIKKTMAIELNDEMVRELPVNVMYENNSLYILTNANNYSLYLNEYKFDK